MLRREELQPSRYPLGLEGPPRAPFPPDPTAEGMAAPRDPAWAMDAQHLCMEERWLSARVLCRMCCMGQCLSQLRGAACGLCVALAVGANLTPPG